MTTVRVVTYFKEAGAKTQLHLSTVNFTTFWFSNFLFDSLLLYCSMAVVYLAVYFGGDPVSSFYLISFDKYHYLLLNILLAFSFAITPANYLFTLFSVDILTSQLAVLIISLVNGFFLMNILISLPTNIFVALAQRFLSCVSPSYAFAVCLNNIFASVVASSSINSQIGSVFVDQELIGESLTTLWQQAIIYLIVVIAVDSQYKQVCVRFARVLKSLPLCLHSVCRTFGCDFASKGVFVQTWAPAESSPLVGARGESGLSGEVELGKREREQGSGRLNLNYGSVGAESGDKVAYGRDSKSDEATLEEGESELSAESTKEIPRPSLVECSDVSVLYPSKAAPALRDVSFRMEAGERVALMGVNGGRRHLSNTK